MDPPPITAASTPCPYRTWTHLLLLFSRCERAGPSRAPLLTWGPTACCCRGRLSCPSRFELAWGPTASSTLSPFSFLATNGRVPPRSTQLARIRPFSMCEGVDLLGPLEAWPSRTSLLLLALSMGVGVALSGLHRSREVRQRADGRPSFSMRLGVALSGPLASSCASRCARAWPSRGPTLSGSAPPPSLLDDKRRHGPRGIRSSSFSPGRYEWAWSSRAPLLLLPSFSM